MQKYRPITVFVSNTQADRLRLFAEATRAADNYKAKDESISSLVRLAVTNLFQDLEEWQDALEWNKQHEADGVVMRNGRSKAITDDMVRRFALAHDTLFG